MHYKVCYSIVRQNTTTLEEPSNGKKSGYGYTILARQLLFSRDNVTCNRTTKVLPSLKVASVGCIYQGSNLEGQEDYQSNCLDDHRSICVSPGITEEIAHKSQTLGQGIPNVTTNGCMKQSCSLYNKKISNSLSSRKQLDKASQCLTG